jgi:hypothetical protein
MVLYLSELFYPSINTKFPILSTAFFFFLYYRYYSFKKSGMTIVPSDCPVIFNIKLIETFCIKLSSYYIHQSHDFVFLNWLTDSLSKSLGNPTETASPSIPSCRPGCFFLFLFSTYIFVVVSPSLRSRRVVIFIFHIVDPDQS